MSNENKNKTKYWVMSSHDQIIISNFKKTMLRGHSPKASAPGRFCHKNKKRVYLI